MEPLFWCKMQALACTFPSIECAWSVNTIPYWQCVVVSLFNGISINELVFLWVVILFNTHFSIPWHIPKGVCIQWTPFTFMEIEEICLCYTFLWKIEGNNTHLILATFHRISLRTAYIWIKLCLGFYSWKKNIIPKIMKRIDSVVPINQSTIITHSTCVFFDTNHFPVSMPVYWTCTTHKKNASMKLHWRMHDIYNRIHFASAVYFIMKYN